MYLTITVFPLKAETPEVVDWSGKQSSIKNQMGRRTCFAFAIVAAIEARYIRDYNLTLDLSEQYFSHLAKSTKLDTSQPGFTSKYKFENGSSYWGGGNAKTVAVAKEYCICTEKDINYKSTIGLNKGYLSQKEMNKLKQYINSKTNNACGDLSWNKSGEDCDVTQSQVDAFEYSPYYIPYSAIRAANKYGVESFEIVKSPKESTNIEQVVAQGYDVIIGIEDKWKKDRNGIYQYSEDAKGGEHIILIVGYDRPNRVFIVKNSWGEKSTIRVSYEVFEKTSDCATYITKVRNPATETAKGRFIGVYNMDYDGIKGTLVIRRATDPENSPARLGHFIDSSGNYKAVNGYNIDDNHGITFTIADSQYTKSGKMSGQVFNVDVFSQDDTHAAGFTTLDKNQYGVLLSRNEIPGNAGGFKNKTSWSGTWKMNHDGWNGTLLIKNSFTGNSDKWQIEGSYTGEDGKTSAVKGYINKNAEYKAIINIAFGNEAQDFTLLYHTRDDNLCSGYTTWNGSKYGVYAVKK